MVKQHQDKHTKLVKTIKAARTRINELNADKDQVHFYSLCQILVIICVHSSALYDCTPCAVQSLSTCTHVHHTCRFLLV